MSAPRFQLIQTIDPSTAKDSDRTTFPADAHESVVVNAGETLALLMHAARTDRAWIRDFADETIRVSRDLYEVLLHYKRLSQKDKSRAA